jgi:hypothetical protein
MWRETENARAPLEYKPAEDHPARTAQRASSAPLSTSSDRLPGKKSVCINYNTTRSKKSKLFCAAATKIFK